MACCLLARQRQQLFLLIHYSRPALPLHTVNLCCRHTESCRQTDRHAPEIMDAGGFFYCIFRSVNEHFMSQNARYSAGHVRASYIIVTSSNVGLCVVRNTGDQAPLVQTVCSAMSHDCRVVCEILKEFT